MRISIPHVYAFDEREGRNQIFQILSPGWSEDATVEGYNDGRAIGFRLQFQDKPEVVVLTNSAQPPDGLPYVLRKRSLELDPENDRELDLTTARWEVHPALPDNNAEIDYATVRSQIIESWKGAFSFREERPEENIKGLREPQVGAVHGVHSHWASSDKPATVVMPTGTGKTETMIATMVSAQLEHILVVVPTDALRTQLSGKFATLGILKDIGVIDESAQLPIVCVLKSKPRTREEVQHIFGRCNVIVTTMAIAGQSDSEVQEEMANECPTLIIDEAHHVSAPSWKSLKSVFSESRILQFTATPYRNDEKPVEGRIVFHYPLRRAQEKGYFRTIHFRPVREFHPEKRDEAIAEAAVAQLREDLNTGYNHVAMARVSSIKRAEEIIELYREYEEFNPVAIHTGIRSMRRRDEIKQRVLSGESRIVVCVDMWGEGFDMPELKIAAFHDVRKSLPVTIQLAGRFTRARDDLGDATVIANIAEIEVQDELRKLYQTDVDWNRLLPIYTEDAIQNEIELAEFMEGFQKFPDEVSLQNVKPAMSTVAYRTHCTEWHPLDIGNGIRGFDSLDRVYIDHNPLEDTLVVLTAKQISVDWAQINEIYTWDWQLYVLHWDREQELLFINNSSNSGFFESIAKTITGDDAELIRGTDVFRCFGGVNRLRLQNVGLLEHLGRLISYTQRTGSNVEPALTEAEKRRVQKANIFGAGFENGHRTTVGCSYKGRLWSRQRTNIKNLTEWCRQVGEKLIDENIDPDEVLRGTLTPEVITSRPNVMPIGIEWPLMFYLETESDFRFEIDGQRFQFHEISLELIDPDENNDLRFALTAPTASVILTLDLGSEDGVPVYTFVPDTKAFIIHHNTVAPLESFFASDLDHTPVISFADGSRLTGNDYIKLKKNIDPYNPSKIEVWNWEGVEITNEAQGIDRDPDSIQYHVITELKKEQFTVIYDDDGSGELADIVTVADKDSSIEIGFYHCKFSRRPTSGRRIHDLYEVCGQAQKSIRWMEKTHDIFTHMMKRQIRREQGRERSRFEVGSMDDLFVLREKSYRKRVDLRVFIVQPGLSKNRASTSQLELLAVTENYLHETYLVPLYVIANE